MMYKHEKTVYKVIFNNLAGHRGFLHFFHLVWVLCIGNYALGQSSDSLRTDTSIQLSRDAITSEVVYSASDSIQFDVAGKIVYLWGNAHITYKNIDLKAATAWIDFNKNLLFAGPMPDSAGKPFGRPIFKEGDKEYRIDTIIYNYATKKGKIFGLITKEGDGIIYCDHVLKDPADNLYGRGARYSTCTDTLNPHFHIRVSKLKIIPKKQIVSGPANLYVADIPTPVYLPFGFFPITQGQKKGFLIPQPGFSPGIGYFLRNLGYYLPLGRHHDLKILSDLYTNTSWGVTLQSTYNYRYKFQGNILFAHHVIKRGDPDVPSEFTKSRTYKFSWSHTMDARARPGSAFSLNINIQSSGYNRTVPTASYQDMTQNSFNSGINYGFSFGKGRFNITTAARHSQNTQTRDVSVSLPDVNFTVNSFAPLERKNRVGALKWFEQIRVGYAVHLLNQINVKDENLFKNETADSMKNGMVHSVPLQLPTVKLFKYFTLSPQLSYREFWYSDYTTVNWDAGSQSYNTIKNKGFKRAYDWNTSASLTTRIYGFFTINKWNINTIRHTITPSVNFVYKPDFSRPEYGFYKYMRPDSILKYTSKYSLFANSIIGGPGYGEAGTITLSVSNNFEMKYRSRKDTSHTLKKIPLLDNILINAGYNFLADSFRLSNIGLSGFLKLFNSTSLQFNGSLDPYLYENGKRKDKYNIYLFAKGKSNLISVGRLTSGNIAISTSISNERFRKIIKSTKGTEAERKMVEQNRDDYADNSIPWTLNVNYTLNYTSYYQADILNKKLTQFLLISGDITVTKNWKLIVSSGYDILAREITATSVDILRDLHCWQMKFNWVPVGPFQRYLFTLSAKSALLQDLKITRRRDAWDR